MSSSNQQHRPFNGMPFLHWLSYRLTWWFLWFAGKILFRPVYHGLEKLPTETPYLLLPNHSSALDPFWVAHPGWRPSRFMGSRQLLQIPFVGAYLKTLGTFSKKKYTRDRDSMETLQRFYDQGFVCVVFPEGNRSWSGRQYQVLPGIGRLIKRMNAEVVYGRMNTAFLFQPRWARFPRWVPIEITYDGPYSYPEHMTAEQITADVQRRITVEPKVLSGKRCWGYKMAHGLPSYLWACPSCFALEALEPDPADGNRVACRSCSAHWTIDHEAQLVGTTDTSVSDAFDLIAAHFGMPPKLETAGDPPSSLVFRQSQTEVLRYSSGTVEICGSGELQLTDTGQLTIITDGQRVWQVSICSLQAISVEVGNKLNFRIDGTLHAIRTQGHSLYMTAHVLRGWLGHLTGTMPPSFSFAEIPAATTPQAKSGGLSRPGPAD